MLLSIFNTTNVYGLRDIEGHKFQTAIERMNYLGILIGDEHGYFNPQETLLRSQAAKVASMISGITKAEADSVSLALGSERFFKDVYADMPLERWSIPWIKLASEAKFIIGDDIGNFNPVASLTMQEWVTILIRILGHEKAEMNWPTDYNNLAISLGLTEGVNFNGTALIKRSEMAQMSVNAIDKVRNSEGSFLSEIFFSAGPNVVNDPEDISEEELDKVVTFLDLEFERLIRQALRNASESIFVRDLMEITSLYIVGNNASIEELDLDSWYGDEAHQFDTLEDIWKLKNLSTLHINFKELSNPEEIGELGNLRALDLSMNNLQEFEFLQSLTRLTSLSLNNNNLATALPLNNLINLETLELAGNRLNSIDFVSTLTRLKSLDVSYNSIENLDSLSNLVNLEELDILSNGVSDISPLGHLLKLESLNAVQNKIVEIKSLENLKKLSTLNLSFNQIEIVEPLRDLTELMYLSLANNKIVDVEPLSKLSNLKTLFLGNNSVADRTPLRFLIGTSIWW